LPVNVSRSRPAGPRLKSKGTTIGVRAAGLLRGAGPELISGASDNDPTNVGTAVAVGAQTGYALSWVAVLVAPLLAVVLTIAARLGAAARDDLQSLAGSLALLGTTLTSYVYVWEVVARGVEEPPRPDADPPARIRAGVIASAVFTAGVLWCMVVASAATLGRYHQPAASAADAARVLRPLAGPAAADLFALGLAASALVALPVLMATTAYVVGAHFGWRRGLSEGIGAAPGFYAVLAASAALGVAVTLAHVPVVGMLVAASIAGGLGTPIGLILLVRLAREPQVMGSTPISRRLAVAGWAVALVVAGMGAAFVLGAVLGPP